MTTLYRVRPGGLFGTKSILQRLDETDGAQWNDVRYSEKIGLFSAVRIRYWQAVEARLAEIDAATVKRRDQRAAKKEREFKASQFADTRMPPT